MHPDAMIKVTCQSADHRFVTGVGPTQPAGRESAKVIVRADNKDGLAHPFGLHGGGHGCRCSAVNDDIPDSLGPAGGAALSVDGGKIVTWQIVLRARWIDNSVSLGSAIM